MLDIKDLRTNPDKYKEALSKRNTGYIQQIDELLSLDEQKRKYQTQTDELKSQRNSLSKSIKSKEEAEEIKTKVQEINKQIQELEEESEKISEQTDNISWYLPNIPFDDVPVGKDETENQEILKWGNIPEIKNPKAHDEIAVELNLWDQENTTRLVGTRFSSYLGYGAMLQRALISFMLEEAFNAGYFEISPPAIIHADILKGTGQLPKFAEDLYHLEDTEYYLIPTAEVPLTGFYAGDKILQEEEIPKRLCAYTPCFRKEAGAAGKDTRGLIRQHQFDKVELVHICQPEDSEAEHQKLVNQAENILQKLELPYRKLLLCTGDMGFSAHKCYDLEVWFPSQNTYREISSCSNCGDFQARRLNLKFKNKETGKNEFCHTLNGSGVAVGRCWAAVIENYLQEDGSVKIPKVLKKYMNGLNKI